MHQFSKKELDNVLDTYKILEKVKSALKLQSQDAVRDALLPPFNFIDPPGESSVRVCMHKNFPHYMVKILSKHYEGVLERVHSEGVTMLFDKKTGKPLCCMHDEGMLFQYNLAAASALTLNSCAPGIIKEIGILGTGMASRYFLHLIKEFTPCREVVVCDPVEAKLVDFKTDPLLGEFRITSTSQISYVSKNSNLIFSATGSMNPLLLPQHIEQGTHLILISPSNGKQEIDPSLFRKASHLVTDHKGQCFQFGEMRHGIDEGFLNHKNVYELGDVLSKLSPGREHENQFSLAEITGAPICDLLCADLFYDRLTSIKF